MTIETKLNIGDKVYLSGILEHFGHIEAMIVEIHITSTDIVYLWEQWEGDKLWDLGEFKELDLGKTIFENLSDWVKKNEDELNELESVSEGDNGEKN